MEKLKRSEGNGENSVSKKNVYQGVLSACKPPKEVLEGELDDAIFAADFGQLIAGITCSEIRDTFGKHTDQTRGRFRRGGVPSGIFSVLSDLCRSRMNLK